MSIRFFALTPSVAPIGPLLVVDRCACGFHCTHAAIALAKLTLGGHHSHSQHEIP